MKEKILHTLRFADDYVSGQQLCQTLGVSRTAVWKVINQLKEEGYIIEAINNKGYKITSYPDILTKEELLSRLKTRCLGRSIYCYEEVGSTNTEAKLLAEQGAPHGSLVIAETQNSGKGRRGRHWTSPKGEGIWMTLILKPVIQPVNASMLTLIAAMAVADAVNACGLSAGIKWPNDVIIGSKKICGILTEMSADMDEINYIVTGIGINANIESFPEELSSVATSLQIESGKKYQRAQIIEDVITSFEYYLDKFLETEDLSGLMEQYNRQLVNCHKQVQVIYPKETWTGTARGINARGELIVETADDLRLVASGEVSVRGILGYI